MSRKADPNSQYRVSIHMNNGYRYASTQPYITHVGCWQSQRPHELYKFLLLYISFLSSIAPSLRTN